MLGKRIAQLRKAAGLNQAQLAKMIGVSPSAIGMYEQGRREPSCALLPELARALGTSTHFLLTGSDTVAHPNPRLPELMLKEKLTQITCKERKGQPLSKKEIALLLATVLTMEE